MEEVVAGGVAARRRVVEVGVAGTEGTQDDVDGGRGLEIADGVEDIGGDAVAIGDAVHLPLEMVLAEALEWPG